MIPHFLQSYNKSLINQACLGPYWEIIGPRSFLYRPRCARSVLSRPQADILPVRPSRLVSKIYIFTSQLVNNPYIHVHVAHMNKISMHVHGYSVLNCRWSRRARGNSEYKRTFHSNCLEIMCRTLVFPDTFEMYFY